MTLFPRPSPLGRRRKHGDRSQLCDEIWDEAKHRINSNWRDGTHDALDELRTGELYGLSYGTGRGV